MKVRLRRDNKNLTTAVIYSFFLQVYLARLKNTLSGAVSWKVDLTDSGLVVDSVTVKAWSNTFENGQVLWKLTGDKEDSPLLVFGGGKLPGWVWYTAFS